MSLMIDPDIVTDVLLADGWHTVEDGSFELDSYEFGVGSAAMVLKGGQTKGVCATGFQFTSRDDIGEYYLLGPLTSILALKIREKQ